MRMRLFATSVFVKCIYHFFAICIMFLLTASVQYAIIKCDYDLLYTY